MVLAGVHDINILTMESPAAHLIERVNRRQVANYYTPEKYKPRRSDEHDISVLELASPLVLSRYIQPACLPSHKPAPDSWCEVAGWGRTKPTKSGMSIAEILGGVGIPTNGNDFFQSVFRWTIFLMKLT